MFDPKLLTQLYSPCGKYTGFFEDGKAPSDWTAEQVYRVSDEDFKREFFWYDGHSSQKFNNVLERLRDENGCRIVFEGVTFTQKECLEIFENALINDLEEASSSSTYEPWENIFNASVFFNDIVKNYGISVEVKDFEEIVTLSDKLYDHGTYKEIISHSVADFRPKMKDKLKFSYFPI